MAYEWSGGKAGCAHNRGTVKKSRKLFRKVITWEKCRDCPARTNIRVRKA